MSSESPFETPKLECRTCGRTDDHTYCIRWMERLHVWASSIRHNGPRWTFRHVKMFGGLK